MEHQEGNRKETGYKTHTKLELFLLEKIRHKQWNIKAREQQWLERLKSTPEANVGYEDVPSCILFRSIS